MKLTDYVAEFLKSRGVGYVFGVTGGAVVHLFDSVMRRGDMQAVFAHHEQAAAFAAQAYARIANGLGAAMVTTGPGGTNALSGVTAAWLDSIPCIYISGQTRLAHTSAGTGVRQIGTQELDIIRIVESVTKYAVMLRDPSMIRYELEKAVHLAMTGRPGPVWLDIPLDFQWAQLDPDSLQSFVPPPDNDGQRNSPLLSDVSTCLTLLEKSERPLVLVGNGVRLAHAEQELVQFLDRFNVPFVATWNASDMVPSEDERCVGRPGLFGQRGANLAVQNCDCLISIGSHLSIPVTGTMFSSFAREAKIVIVDVDRAELDHRTVRADVLIQSDAREFLRAMLHGAGGGELHISEAWRQTCSDYRRIHNSVKNRKSIRGYVDPYRFMDVLSDLLDNDIIVVDGGGTVNQVAFQALRTKLGQRLMIDAGLCSMGSGLPSSVGACFAAGKRRTLCLSGDGSFQFNVQELQTIVHHQLPVKLFVMNNSGYLSIRNTQDGFLEGRHVGSASDGGLSIPDIGKVAKAYGVPSFQIGSHRKLEDTLRHVLELPGPAVCDVRVSPNQEIAPRQGFDKLPDGTSRPRPLEDMYPYLPREEFARAMRVKPVDASR